MQTTTNTDPDSAAFTFAVRSKTCTTCAVWIERALNAVPGVENASINLATETDHPGMLGDECSLAASLFASMVAPSLALSTLGQALMPAAVARSALQQPMIFHCASCGFPLPGDGVTESRLDLNDLMIQTANAAFFRV